MSPRQTSKPSWYTNLSDAIQRRAGKYLINRYLGLFLEDGQGIAFDQISSEEDAIVLKNVQLNIQSINKSISSQSGYEFVDGFIRELRVSVPWSNLMQDSASFDIDGLTLTLQVSDKATLSRSTEHKFNSNSDLHDDINSKHVAASIFYSMYESFSTSATTLDLAEECIAENGGITSKPRHDVEDADVFYDFTGNFSVDEADSMHDEMPNNEFENTHGTQESGWLKGVELLAHAIDSILNRVKLHLTDTTFRVEYVHEFTGEEVNHAIALEMRISQISYSGSSLPSSCLMKDQQTNDVHLSLSDEVDERVISLANIRFYTDQFMFPRVKGEKLMSHSMLYDSAEKYNDKSKVVLQPSIQFGQLAGTCEITVHLGGQGRPGISFLIEEVSLSIKELSLHIFPHQLQTISDIVYALTRCENRSDLNKTSNVNYLKQRQLSSLSLNNKPGVVYQKQFDNKLEQMIQQSFNQSVYIPKDSAEFTERMPISSSYNDVFDLEKAIQTKAFKEFDESKLRENVVRGEDPLISENSKKTSIPRIKAQIAKVKVVIVEQDLFVSYLHSENIHSDHTSDNVNAFRSSAAALMKHRSDEYFFNESSKSQNNLRSIHTMIHEKCSKYPHISVVMINISADVSHHASRSQQTNLHLPRGLHRQDFIQTTLTIAKCSVRECLKDNSSPSDILIFDRKSSLQSDIRLVHITPSDIFQPVSVDVTLNGPVVHIDPTLLDRTCLITNYTLLDHNWNLCDGASDAPSLSSSDDKTSTSTNCHINIKCCDSLQVVLHTPHCDLRNKPSFLSDNTLKRHQKWIRWRQKVEVTWCPTQNKLSHPEKLVLSLTNFSSQTKIQRDQISSNTTFSSLTVEMRRDGEEESHLIVDSSNDGSAQKISVVVNNDKGGHLNYGDVRNEKKTHENNHFDIASFEHVNIGAKKTKESNEEDSLKRCLNKSSSQNNLSIIVKLNSIRILLPQTDVYEILYNRLGNDLVLWSPSFFDESSLLLIRNICDEESRMSTPTTATVVLSNAANVSSTRSSNFRLVQSQSSQNVYSSHGNFNLLEDVNPSCFRPETEEMASENDIFEANLFFEISVEKSLDIFARVASADDDDPQECYVLHINTDGLHTKVATKEKGQLIEDINMDVSILHVEVGNQLEVSYAKIDKSVSLNDYVDDVSTPNNVKRTVLLKSKNGLMDDENGSKTLEVYSKIKFDTVTNLENISMNVNLSNLAFVWNIPNSHVADTDNSVDSFNRFLSLLQNMILNCKEYPIRGYVPPSIMTEVSVHVQTLTTLVTQDAAYSSSDAVELAIDIQSLRVSACHFDEASGDLNISVQVENMHCLCLSNTVSMSSSRAVQSPAKTLICVGFANLDFVTLDLMIKGSNEEQAAYNDIIMLNNYDDSSNAFTVTDVTITGNVLSFQTCIDTMEVLVDFIRKLVSSYSTTCNEELDDMCEVTTSDDSNDLKSENHDQIVPDIADAMSDLSLRDEGEEEHRRLKDKQRERSSPFSNTDIMVNLEREQNTTSVFYFPGETPHGDPNRSDLSLEERNVYDAFTDHENESEENVSGEDFCILENVVGSGIRPTPDSEPLIQTFFSGTEDRTIDGFILRENSFLCPPSTGGLLVDSMEPVNFFPPFVTRFTVRRISLLWQFFGGHDFPRGKSAIKPQSSPPSHIFADVAIPGSGDTSPRKSDSSVLDSKLRKIETTVSSIRSVGSTSQGGGMSRRTQQLIEVYLSRVQFQHEEYSESSTHRKHDEISRQLIVIPHFEVRDKLSKSQINKLLHLYVSQAHPKQTSMDMLTFRCVKFKASNDNVVEASIVMSVQPIRINLDQDTLLFLVDQFSKLKSSSSRRNSQGVVVERRCSSSDEPPCMQSSSNSNSSRKLRKSVSPDKPKVYIKSFTFEPSVPIRIDYIPKYVDLSQGAITGLIVGLTDLNSSELTLKCVHYKHGISGVDSLVNQLTDDWITDIKCYQIPSILGGVGPLSSFAQLISGVSDLFYLPVEQYKRDGRIFRGLQRGATSFSTSTTLSFLDLTNRLLGMIRCTAELAFTVLSPVDHGQMCIRDDSSYSRSVTATNVAYYRRRTSGRNGMATGHDKDVNSDDDDGDRDNITEISSLLRNVPAAVIRPVIYATTATSQAIEGVQAQVDPDFQFNQRDLKFRKS